MKPITVVIAEDHLIVREGIRMMLELEPDLKVVGEAQDGRQAVALAVQLRPDVILMDIAMAKMNGLEATRQVRKAVPEVKVLILSAHADNAYVESALEAGACGFLLKQSSGHDVGSAIRKAHLGQACFTSSIARNLERQRQQSGGANGHLENAPVLTQREREVLQLIAEGKANKESAAELGISIKTVEKHRQNLMEKLGIHETAGLTRYAISAGIVESSVQVTIT